MMPKTPTPLEEQDQTLIDSEDDLYADSFEIIAQESIIEIVAGPHEGLRVPLNRELFHIGRAAWCDVALPQDKRASKHHCEVQLTDRGIQVRDLGSRNGTQISGVPINDAYWLPHLVLQVGNSTLELRTASQQRTIAVHFADSSGTIVGKSPQMRKLFAMLHRLGPHEVPVLLTGETGTGKTSLARALHNQSRRAKGPFVVVNCGALSTTLIESSLFGYEKGAFTNASQRHHGFFEQADGGTLFLDEIAELPIDLQPKLLDAIERKCIRRLGGEQEIPVDFRLLTATHQQLPQAVLDGTFRQDLYYRLAVVELAVPPLRERLEDIPLLANQLLSKTETSDELVGLTPAARKKLQRFLWPGNVRQLRNVLERSLIFREGQRIDAHDIDLPEEHTDKQNDTPDTDASAAHTLKQQLETSERQIVADTLAQCDGDVASAAAQLEVSKSWLYGRIKRYGLS